MRINLQLERSNRRGFGGKSANLVAHHAKIDRLRNIVCTIQRTLRSGPQHVANKFANPNFKALIQMVEETYIPQPLRPSQPTSEDAAHNLVVAERRYEKVFQQCQQEDQNDPVGESSVITRTATGTGTRIRTRTGPPLKRIKMTLAVPPAGDQGTTAKLHPCPKQIRDIFFFSDGSNLKLVQNGNKDSPATIGGAFNVITTMKMGKFQTLKELLWTLNLAGSTVAEFLPIIKDEIHVNSKLEVFGFHVTDEDGILTNFDLDNVKLALAKIITKILDSSKYTMHTFVVLSPLTFFDELEFPTLPQVAELSLRTLGSYKRQHFPRRFDLGSIFPNLTKIFIDFSNMDKNESWDTYFKVGFGIEEMPLPILTVKSIKIHKTCKCFPLGWMTKLADLFPNVENVTIKTIHYNFPDAAEGLWKFQHLKRLNLKINAWANENVNHGVDAAFTGISARHCKPLSLHILKEPRASILTAMKVKPAISDLKELRRLHVTFVNWHKSTPMGFDIKKYETALMTELTGKYALRKCQNLKVHVRVEGKTPRREEQLLKLLEPLTPYVHVQKSKTMPIITNDGHPLCVRRAWRGRKKERSAKIVCR